MDEPKIGLPKTHWTADEFIKLLNAIIDAKTIEEAEAASAELKRQRRQLEANQKAIQGGNYHQN